MMVIPTNVLRAMKEALAPEKLHTLLISTSSYTPGRFVTQDAVDALDAEIHERKNSSAYCCGGITSLVLKDKFNGEETAVLSSKKEEKV